MIELKPVFHEIDFKDLNKRFNHLFQQFSPIKNYFSIEDYFGAGKGLVTATRSLANDEYIEKEEDFQGIYVFSKNKKPFYVGMSQHVIERIIQHVKGKSHFTSSFCYKLGANEHIRQKGHTHEGGRGGLGFDEYVEPYKKELMKCQAAIFEVENCLELYLFEVFVAMKLGTLHYNLFKTH